MNKPYSEELAVAKRDFDEMYDNLFGDYHAEVIEMYKRFQSDRRAITDDELNWILTTLPLLLFDVAEKLNGIKLEYSVISIKCKEAKIAAGKASDEKTITARQDAAFMTLIDENIAIALYQTIIERVEQEISISKELIMGAKKIWDGRRKTEEVNPVGTKNLPEYKSPIFGGTE